MRDRPAVCQIWVRNYVKEQNNEQEVPKEIRHQSAVSVDQLHPQSRVLRKLITHSRARKRHAQRFFMLPS